VSWYGLLSILKDQQQTITEYRRRTPTACPNDGEPLRDGPNGSRFCPFDGWQYPRDWHEGQT
jgi:hypothetical protein